MRSAQFKNNNKSCNERIKNSTQEIDYRNNDKSCNERIKNSTQEIDYGRQLKDRGAITVKKNR